MITRADMDKALDEGYVSGIRFCAELILNLKPNFFSKNKDTHTVPKSTLNLIQRAIALELRKRAHTAELEIFTAAGRRPGLDSLHVRQAVAQKFLYNIRGWAAERWNHAISDEIIIHDVSQAIHMSFDGYDIAKVLDDLGWKSDSKLVAIFSDVYEISENCINDAVNSWIVKHNIEPKHSIGDQVFCSGLMIYGEVIDILPYSAKYIVQLKSGHTEKCEYEFVRAVSKEPAS